MGTSGGANNEINFLYIQAGYAERKQDGGGVPKEPGGQKSVGNQKPGVGKLNVKGPQENAGCERLKKALTGRYDGLEMRNSLVWNSCGNEGK